MRRKIRKLTKAWGDIFFWLFFLCYLLRHWIGWMQWLAYGLLALYATAFVVRIAADFRHNLIYLALCGGLKWQRFKRMYKGLLQAELTITIMMIVVFGAVIIGIIIKG